MAQASTLVPVTKTKKHKRGRLRYRGYKKARVGRHALFKVSKYMIEEL